MTLDELEAWIMRYAEDRWYVSARNPERNEICVDISVANPGWEEHWVLIWVSPEKAQVSMLSRGHGDKHYCDALYEMTPDQLVKYLKTLPRPIQSFGAKDISDQVPVERG